MGIAAALWQATPFLAGGFAGNLAISALAMLAGTLIGTALARGRDARPRPVRAAAGALTGLCRNVPSFVLMFYVALVLPVEVAWGGSLVTVPLAAKATLALTIPVIGFASDQGLALRRQRREGAPDAAATYAVSWLQYALIILMASSTASVIGADEIVGRANRLIAADDRPAFLLATYAYVAGWFLACGLAVSAAGSRLIRPQAATPPKTSAISASSAAASSSSKAAAASLSRSSTPRSAPPAPKTGTTISDRVEAAQAMCPGKASTSGTTWVRRSRAAAPQTPRSKGMTRQP